MMRMRINLLVAVIYVVVTAATAQAQQAPSGFVESWNKVSAEGATPQINVYVRGPLKEKVGWSAFTLTTKTWSQAYAGLTFVPAKWIEVSASLGLESADSPLREAV